MDLFDTVPQAALLLHRGWQPFSALLQQLAEQVAERLRVRLVHVPGRQLARPSVSELRVSDCGQLVRLAGTVTRAGARKVVQEWRSFRCEPLGGCRRADFSGDVNVFGAF